MLDGTTFIPLYSCVSSISQHPSCGSMGKLVNPFASHAKDPRFEPEWNHVCVLFCLLFLLFQEGEITEVRKQKQEKLIDFDFVC